MKKTSSLLIVSLVLLVGLIVLLVAYHAYRQKEEFEAFDAVDKSLNEYTEKLKSETEEAELRVIRINQGDLMALKVKTGQASMINLESNVDGASVYVDGKFMGSTKAVYAYGKQVAKPNFLFAIAIPKDGRDTSTPSKIVITDSGYRNFETSVYLNQREIKLKASLEKIGL